MGCQQRTDSASGSAHESADRKVLNVDLNRGVAATVAASSEQVAYAWITLGEDGATGELSVMTNAGPVKVYDSEASPVYDPETPPQIEYGEDGLIHLAYAATQDIDQKWKTMGVRYTVSKDAGVSWSMPVSVGGDGFGGYRNDHELHVASDGSVYVAWLDSREGFGGEGTHVVISRTTDNGESWSSPVSVDGAPSCECCRVVIASDSRGTVYVAWRKIMEGGIRDIAVSRSDDFAKTWSTPTRVHADDWVMGFCPDAGPSLRVDGNDVLHTAWWTGKEGEAGVRYSQSVDGGKTFSEMQSLKSAEKSRPSHVQVLLGEKGKVAVVWDDGTLQKPRIALRRSENNGGSFSDVEYVSASGVSAAYPSGVYLPDGIVLAWHERATEKNAVRTRDESGDVWSEGAVAGVPQLATLRIR